MPLELDRTETAAGGPRAIAAASSHAVGPGTRLAHFRIERLLGQGGMGQVWLATDLALDRPVALKLLPAETAGDRDRRDRLVREARAQARLMHPNVCHIYFIGEDEGRMFFAMEYVDGETLSQRLERGPLAPDEAVELTRMAALGLRAADEAGFTHRDIKPSNLMIDRHGVLKVMDFGLVASSPGDVIDVDGAPVAASALVGTPLYMAPEQGRGEAVDRRADIYALGATLHHMIAGAPPFTGDSAAQLLSRHETAVRPKLTQSSAKVRRTATLADDVVARMMAKRATDRYQTYDELLAALDRASTERTRPAGMMPRGVAAFADLMIALLISSPLIILFPDLDENIWVLAVWVLLYPFALSRWGTTPGRALLDLEVVNERGDGRVTFLQAALRFLAQYSPIVLGSALVRVGDYVDNGWVRAAASVPVALGLAYVGLSVLATATRSIDKRTPWDRVSGTRTCYRRASRTDARKVTAAAVAMAVIACVAACEPPAPAPVYTTTPRPIFRPQHVEPASVDPATWGELIDARDDLVFDGGRLHFELRHDHGRVIQTVRNDYAVEVTLNWGVRDLDNLALGGDEYGGVTLPASLVAGGPGPTVVLTNFMVLRPAQKFWRVLDFRARFGDPAARPRPYSYALPFGVGQERRVIQGFGGGFSHTGSQHYAVDFDAPEGTPILAARDGLVVAANALSSGHGATRDWLDYTKMNFILVRHDDGTLGEYLHLQHGGVRVKAGTRVNRLDFIGLSGNTGFSNVPHLHFHVMTAAPGGVDAQSFPIEFEVAPGVRAAPVEGRAYRAYERPVR